MNFKHIEALQILFELKTSHSNAFYFVDYVIVYAIF